MIVSLKEHKASVSSIKIRPDGKECVSASDDGSCIIWDIARGSRLQAMFAPTMFKDVLYHPDESQLLTCGSDRKLTYWDAYDGTAIRIVEGSRYELNALDIDPEGVKFVSGGNDCLVKVYDYDDGEVRAIGEGHSGGITAVKFSPDLKSIVSVGAEGGIFVWKYDATLKDGSGEVDYEGKEAKLGD
jgi:WD40 repeat protein